MLFRFKISVLLFMFFCSSYGTVFEGAIKYDDLNESKFSRNASYLPNIALPIYSNVIDLHQNNQVRNLKLTIVRSSVIQISNTSTYVDYNEAGVSYSVQRARQMNSLQFSFSPYFNKNGAMYRIDEFQIEYTAGVTSTNNAKLKSSNSSVLSKGEWVKIKFSKSGIYRITASDLSGYGFTNIETVRIFGYSGEMLNMENGDTEMPILPEVPIQVFDGGDGKIDGSDYVLFYGQSPHAIKFDSVHYMNIYNCYSEYSYLLITVNNGSPLNISTKDFSSLSSGTTVDYFDDVQFYEVNDTNLVRSGRQWFESSGDRSYSFSFPNAVASKPSELSYQVVGLISNNFKYQITFNNLTYIDSLVGGASAHNVLGDGFFTVPNSSANPVVHLKKNNSGNFWLDYLVLSVPCRLQLRSGQLVFRNKSTVDYSAVTYSFSDPNITVWDVSDFNNVYAISSINSQFKVPGGELKTLVAFDKSSFLTPEFAGKVQNQNLSGASIPDMLIIAHPDFRLEATRLANLHKNQDGIVSFIVSQEQIFNEFSSGRPDVTAIRNYIRHLYLNDNKLRYVLLFGDGSYDNSDLNADNTLIGTYQSYKSTSEYDFVSDDYFGLLDAGEGEVDQYLTGALDIGVGRIPVNTISQAKVVVDKIIHYSTSDVCRGRWRNNMAFIGDDGDGDLHMRQSDSLVRHVEGLRGEMLYDKIFSDTYPLIAGTGGGRYPAVNDRIDDAIKKGVLVFNYTGHGNPVQLAVERLLTVADLNLWQNYDKLPLVITASCEVSRFDDHTRPSLGERMLLHDEGGAIGLLTTTRLVFSNSNFELNWKMYDYLFANGVDGKPNRLGDVVRLSKVAIGDDHNKRNFSLLGDPALRLVYPQNVVITDSINGESIEGMTDTISALSEVTIKGHISDPNGKLVTSYNGIVFPTVLDKKRRIFGLDNSSDGDFSFDDQVNILFKGKATVKNGYFSFTFLVPKDISYSHGAGRISYYADNGFSDASGYNTNFVVGGSNTDTYSDNEGPRIELYMNDTSFVFGGTTDETPTLLVKVSDSSGVNITGNTVGHDLTAVLDRDIANSFILNEFYESDVDSYKHGTVSYPLSKLEEGKHELQVKVWDAVNNSTEDFIEFYVAESAAMALKHVLNYPNPFTTNTAFYFEHNQTGQRLDVLVQIFTISGKVVKTIESTQFSTGFRSDAVAWDGLDDFGDKIGRGVYIYRIKVRSEDGGTAEAYEKLVLLR